jgi:hypothetical protein
LTRTFDLSLPEPERRHAALLGGPWRDLLYVPRRGFTSPIEPGIYSSSFVVVLADGPALRVSSLVVPAFGGEICRLRLEALSSYRPENLGSFFEPSRRGNVFALPADRGVGLARPPNQPGWSYDGPSLGERLADVRHVRLLREHVRGGAGAGAFSWTADRGLVLTSATHRESVLLALPAESDNAALISPPGLHRALFDRAAAPVPGASPAELLGYGDRTAPFDVAVHLEALSV